MKEPILLPEYGSEFKNDFGKVLGTQNHPSMGRLSLIVSYIFISLKSCLTSLF